MNTKVLIMFPYNGYAPNTTKKQLFWAMIERAKEVTHDDNPTIILNCDTKNRNQADDFLNDPRTEALDVQKVWSVDTCQMWLSGWGYVIENFPSHDRVVQLPGDLEAIEDQTIFFRGLQHLLGSGPRWDIVIGDFSSGARFGAKDLIDRYGTYVLLANWFPKLTKAILQLPLNRPRSEFLNLKITTLKELLKYRKFAYEQTLNILIRSWDFNSNKWKYDIAVEDLGTLQDENAYRQYRACLDQIERTERMLKLLWREIREDDFTSRDDFIDRYHQLDRVSTSSRETAAVTIRALLDLWISTD